MPTIRELLSNWTNVLTKDQLNAYWDEYSKLDPYTARQSKQWWDEQPVAHLYGVAHGSWLSNDREGYIIANTYIKQKLH